MYLASAMAVILLEGIGYYIKEVNCTDVSRASLHMVSLLAISSSHYAAILHKGEKSETTTCPSNSRQ